MLQKLIVSLCFVLVTTLTAQVLPVGTVDGTVKDPSGALLTGIKVTLKNLDTGVSRDATTNESGYFFFPLTIPGRYEVAAEKTGFKRGTQEIGVRTGIRSTADFSLELGQITESVQVSGQAALLETTTSAISRNVEKRVITDMPLLARNVLMLINLSPGITNNTPSGGSNGLIDIDSYSYTSASGANNRTNEFLMDGIPNNVSDRVAYIPGVDAVEEFTVQTNALDAEYGHGGGMYVNVTTKGGTNEIHGNLYEFFRNDKLNANAFFSNKAGAKRPVFRFNQFGLTAGGPIIKDKVFWFFNFEGIRQKTPRQYRFTVPTALQRTGDFSQTFNAAGALFQIADPLTTTATGARTLFGDNRIPASRLNTIAKNVLARYPAPTSLGDPFTDANNFFSEVPAPYGGENYSLRIDPNFRKHRFFVRWSQNQGFPEGPTPWDIGGKGVGAPEGNNRAQTSIGLSDAFVLNPSTVITGQAGFTRWTQEGIHPEFDPATLGFPACAGCPDATAQFPAVRKLGHVLHRGLGRPVVRAHQYLLLQPWRHPDVRQPQHEVRLPGPGEAEQLDPRESSDRPVQFRSRLHSAERVCVGEQPGQRNCEFAAGESRLRVYQHQRGDHSAVSLVWLVFPGRLQGHAEIDLESRPPVRPDAGPHRAL